MEPADYSENTTHNWDTETLEDSPQEEEGAVDRVMRVREVDKARVQRDPLISCSPYTTSIIPMERRHGRKKYIAFWQHPSGLVLIVGAQAAGHES